MEEERVLAGIRPSGRMHLGHWFSIIKPAKAGATILIATYHAPSGSMKEYSHTLETIQKYAPKAEIYLFLGFPE